MREVRKTSNFVELNQFAYDVEPICGPERSIRRKPLFVEDLSGRDLTHNLLDRVPVDATKVMAYTCDGASLRGVETVISRSDHIITRYVDADDSRLQAYAEGHGADFGSADMGIRIEDGRILLEDREEKVLHGPHALISPEEGFNYGMWLLQAIPYVDYLVQNGYDGRMICFAEAGWQPRFLNFLGISERVERQVRGQAYRIEGPLKAFRQQYRNLAISARDREAYGRLKRRADIAHASPPHERIFISRRTRSRAQPLYRALTNEDALIEAVRALGFHVVEPETLGFAEQVSLFAQARVVVGLGGAGMFNTVFCAPDTTVISIESSNVWISAHANLFATAGVQYGIIFGAEDMSVDQQYHKPWSVDVPAAIRAIRSVL